MLGAATTPSSSSMNHTSAVFAARRHHLLLVAEHQGHRRVQRQGLKVMQITTVMVVILLIWGVYSVFMQGAHLPPPPTPSNLHFSDDALGFLKGTKFVPLLGLFGILMAFGHSVLAMSGEESLAQVNREIEHPKLKNLKRAAIVIAIYSLHLHRRRHAAGLHAHSRLGATTSIRTTSSPAWPCTWSAPMFCDRLPHLRRHRRLPDSFRRHQHLDDRLDRRADARRRRWRPHRLVPQAAQAFGTSYRIVNLVFACRCSPSSSPAATSSCSARRMPSASSGRFTFNSLAMLVLRWKYHGERGWKVPPNIRIGKTEIPIGLLSVFLVLLTTAIVNLFTKSVATVSGIIFAAAFFIIFSSPSGEAQHALTARQMKEHFQLEHEDTSAAKPAAIRPGGVMVTMRDRQSLRAQVGALPHQHRRAGCRRAHRPHDGRRRPGVSRARRSDLQRARADGLHQGCLRRRELWQESLAAGRPAGDIFAALVQTANSLEVDSVVSGLSTKMTAEDQAFHMGQAWEALPEPKRQFNFYVINPSGESRSTTSARTRPSLRPDDVQLVHRLWLNLRRDPSMPGPASQRHHHLCATRLASQYAREKQEIKYDLSSATSPFCPQNGPAISGGCMQLSKILAEIDLEISRLEQARTLLAGDSRPAVKKTRKAKSADTGVEAPTKRKKKRNLSPEGRKRIAEAVRRRWELQKKAAGK
jgi:hypothetical protein